MLYFCTYDVFTTQRYSGNPLAIVEGAESLDSDQMQTIAREFNLSETIFVMPPKDPAHDAKVRIFFPTAEIPFAGHPTLGCAIYLAAKKYGDGDFSGRIVLEEEAGIVPVDVTRAQGMTRGWFSAPVLPHDTPASVTPELAAQALGLTLDQIATTDRPGVWQGGPRFVYICLRDTAALAVARPIEPYWSDLTQACGTGGVYIYCHTAKDQLQSRMFAPTDGIPEDPATGSATAILAAQLLAMEHLPDGETTLQILQGAEMGRPSHLGLRIMVDAGALTSVRVGGAAVAMNSGQLMPPDREG